MNNISRMKCNALSILSAALGVPLSLIALTCPAHAQPLFTITAQDRSVSSSVQCIGGSPISQTFAATDFNSWSHEAYTFCNHSVPNPGGSNWVRAFQSSTITEHSLSGHARAMVFQQFGGTVGSNAPCSLTFTTTMPLRYDFAVFGQNFVNIFSVSLSGAFSFNHPASGTTATGVLSPGTYMFTWTYSNCFRDCDTIYSLNFSHPFPDVVAGPIPGVDGCNHNRVYYQLAASNRIEAELTAQALGGHLVTIDNPAEQAWLQSTFAAIGPPDKWIGLSAALAPGTTTFRWETGELPTYTNWAPGLPIAGQGDYVLYQSGGDWIQSTDAFTTNTVGGIVEVIVPDPCHCDWNHDGRRDSSDFFAFLSDFFTTGADYDCSGMSDSADFFRFLGCFLSSICQ